MRACALFIYAYLWRGKSGYSGYKPHSLRPMCAHLATQLCALGESAQTLLFPLFYALSALNADRAYQQVAPTAPGVAQPLPFTELVLRTPHVPVTYPN